MAFPPSKNPNDKVRSPRSLRLVSVGIMVVAAVIAISVLFYFVLGSLFRPRAELVQLEGAVRAGSPDFEQLSRGLNVAKPVALKSSDASGDLLMQLNTTVRNDTGRRIRGLEMRGVVLNAHGLAVAERTVIPIPAQQTVLEPGEALNVRIQIEGITEDTERADIAVEVTAVLFD